MKLNIHDASEEKIPEKTDFREFGDFDRVNKEVANQLNDRLTELNKYLILAENPSDFNNELKRIQLFGNLSYGLRKAGEGLALTLYLQKMAKGRRKSAEANAYLNNFGRYLIDQKELGFDVKATDKTKEHYVALDRNVLDANEYEAMMDAYEAHFSTIRNEFTQAISTLRAMCYGMKDSQNISSAAGSMG